MGPLATTTSPDLVKIKTGQLIYNVRKAAGLSRDLAKRRGPTKVICRLEGADYSGLTMAMFHQIGSMLGDELLHAIPDEAV